MPCPIAPNDELIRLREVLDECARCEYSLSDRNLRILGLILDRVRDAQTEGRVLPDPEDDQPWDRAILGNPDGNLLVQVIGPDGVVQEERTYKPLRRSGGSPTGTPPKT